MAPSAPTWRKSRFVMPSQVVIEPVPVNLSMTSQRFCSGATHRNVVLRTVSRNLFSGPQDLQAFEAFELPGVGGDEGGSEAVSESLSFQNRNQR